MAGSVLVGAIGMSAEMTSVALWSAVITAFIYTAVLFLLLLPRESPHKANYSTYIHSLMHVSKRSAEPSITLVGAGPGDIGLLTLSAVNALKSADLVLSDKLTSETGKDILSIVTCEVRIAQKYKVAGSAKRAQDELNALGLAALKQGKRVVRLKCGDPFVFGRGGEEVLFFREHGFEALVIPGVSSALFAPMAAGIPVTHRGVANEFLVSTGMLKEGAVSQVPPYSSSRTTVLLMAVGRLPRMTTNLLQSGYPSNCPVAIVERAGTPQQRVIRSSVISISETGAKCAVSSPAVIVIGDAVQALQDKRC